MDKAMELVEQLATKLGVAAEYLWTVLIKQQYADGIVDIILAVFGVGVLIMLMVGAPKLTTKYLNEYIQLKEDRIKNGSGYHGSYFTSSIREDHCKEMYEQIPCWAVAIGIIVLVATLLFIVFGVKQVINPEYFALKEVLNAIQYPG